MTVDIKFHDPIYTNDGHKVGIAQRLYRKPDDDTELDTDIHSAHLKVFDFETGDDFYIPTAYLTEPSDKGDITLSISLKRLGSETLSRTPRYIAYEIAQTTELPK